MEPNTHLAKPQFKKLARRAGVKRLEDVYDLLRSIVNRKLTDILRDSILLMQHMSQKILQQHHIDQVVNVNICFTDSGAKRKRSYDNFNNYIHRVLDQVHPGIGITEKSLNHINSAIKVIGNALASKANDIVDASKKQTITAKSIQTAVCLLIHAECAKHAVGCATEATTRYTATINDPDPKKEKQSKGFRAGLQFSPSRVKNVCLSNTNKRISDTTIIYLTAVLEYITREILELSGNCARDNKCVRIKPRHIFLTIKNDYELNELFESLKIVIPESGVMPHIHTQLLPHKSDDEEEPKRGTVALKEIRSLQKSTDRIFAAKTFKSLVKSIVDELQLGEVKIAADTHIMLQEYIEKFIIDLLANALLITLNADRLTVTAKDIELACLLANHKIN